MTRLSRVILLAACLSPGAAAAGAAEVPGPAYLAYAGPYASSPSSAFGHLFLVLASGPEQPAPLWDVVTFNAVTFDADPLRYLTVGVLGGFLGRFSRLPFHEKTREYELLDDRDLWLVELRLTAEHRAALEAALEAARGRWYPYDFFHLNCAWYLQETLAAATGAIPHPSGPVGPTDVMRVAGASALGGATFHRPSATRRVHALAAGAREEVRRRLEREDWKALAAEADWLAALTGTERRLVQATFGLRALEQEEALPPATLAGLARLRLLDVEAAAQAATPAEPSGPGLPVPAPRFHRYGRLRLSYAAPPVAPAAPGWIVLRYRPAMHDDADPPIGLPGSSALELLGVRVSSPARRAAPRIDEAVLFSQRALGPSDWLRSPLAWLLEAGAWRGGLFDPTALHGEVRGGLGRAVRLPGEHHLHALATLTATGAVRHGLAAAPGVEVGLAGLAFPGWRYGARWERQHDLARLSRWSERGRAFLRIDLGAALGLRLDVERAVDGEVALLGLDWYP